MKKTPSRPSREETREHQHRIAELDDYRQAKYDRDAPLPPAGMMSNTQILRREAARNLKALPDRGEAVYAETIRQIQEECETALERDEYPVLRRLLALRGPRLLIEVPPVGWRVQEW